MVYSCQSIESVVSVVWCGRQVGGSIRRSPSSCYGSRMEEETITLLSGSGSHLKYALVGSDGISKVAELGGWFNLSMTVDRIYSLVLQDGPKTLLVFTG